MDAIATDHAPNTVVAKTVEFGDAANGISGLETAIGQLLAAVDAGVLDLLTVARALTVGPSRVLSTAGASGGASGDGPTAGTLPGSGLVVGGLADLVLVDRESSWSVEASTLRTRGHNTPLLGRQLPGRVMTTIAAGRWAWRDESIG